MTTTDITQRAQSGIAGALAGLSAGATGLLATHEAIWWGKFTPTFGIKLNWLGHTVAAEDAFYGSIASIPEELEGLAHATPELKGIAEMGHMMQASMISAKISHDFFVSRLGKVVKGANVLAGVGLAADNAYTMGNANATEEEKGKATNSIATELLMVPFAVAAQKFHVVPGNVKLAAQLLPVAGNLLGNLVPSNIGNGIRHAIGLAT